MLDVPAFWRLALAQPLCDQHGTPSRRRHNRRPVSSRAWWAFHRVLSFRRALPGVCRAKRYAPLYSRRGNTIVRRGAAKRGKEPPGTKKGLAAPRQSAISRVARPLGPFDFHSGCLQDAHDAVQQLRRPERFGDVIVHLAMCSPSTLSLLCALAVTTITGMTSCDRWLSSAGRLPSRPCRASSDRAAPHPLDRRDQRQALAPAERAVDLVAAPERISRTSRSFRARLRRRLF